MPTTTVWCLVINHEYKPVGSHFKVFLENDTNDIADLKKKVKEEQKPDLDHIAGYRLAVWRCKEPKLLSEAKPKQLRELLKIADFSDEAKVEELSSGKKVIDLGLDDEILLVQVLNVSDAIKQEVPDTVPELPEFQRFNNTLATKGKSPSEGAKSTEYRSIQRDPFQAIYDGLAPTTATFSTVAPPIHIYHPVFDKFAFLINDPNSNPTTEDLINVQTLMRRMSEIYDSEAAYSHAVRSVLEGILGFKLTKAENVDDKVTADGAITEQDAVLLIKEDKLFIGSGGDPSTQAGITMRRYWIDSSRRSICNKCCCPTFIIAAAGAWLCVMGGVFTDRVIVQRLTDLKWAGLSSTEEETRIVDNARIFVALRICLRDLQNVYKGLAVANIPDLLPGVPHPRFFPYPTSYTQSDGRHVKFRYIRPLEKDESTCITFLAEIISGDEVKKVVVKFATRYGRDVHEYLASKGKAPKLYYFGQLPEARRPPGLGIMRMIIMEYITDTTAPADARNKIEEILIDLHSEGYVFGDLRRPNILFDQTGKAFLIDFNWCGRYDLRMGHDGIPEEVQARIEVKLASAGCGDGEFARYPLAMSRIKDMWVEGMKARELIIPKHDWGMLNKLDF